MGGGVEPSSSPDTLPTFRDLVRVPSRFVSTIGYRDLSPWPSWAFTAKERQLGFTSVVMRGAGPETPPKHVTMIGQWALRERLPEPEARWGNQRAGHEAVYSADLTARTTRCLPLRTGPPRRNWLRG